MEKSINRVILFVFIVFSPVPGRTEILRLPPVQLKPRFTPSFELLSGIAGWFDFHHYTTQAENDNFSQDSEMGILFTLFSSENVSFQALTREIIQNQVNYFVHSSLGFYLRALLTDLRLTATLNAELFFIKAGFRHDCKHDIDRFLGRNAVHDTLFLGIDSKRFDLPWGKTAFFSGFKAGFIGEINLPYIFQEVKPEPDKSRISFSIKSIILGHKDYGSVFFNGKVSVIQRKTEGTAVYPVISPAIDWLIQSGYRTPGKDRSLVLYYQNEYITDPWVSNNSVPVHLSSIGVLIAVGK
ncbi:MAG: hypothetical protein GXP33_00205 [Spirochaetes bacterium]|nr:hypothetical protein [Spirochaetota bacterium]